MMLKRTHDGADVTTQGVTLKDLLVVENDPAIVDVRCHETGIPVWGKIRVHFIRMMMSDLFYSTPLDRPVNTHVPATRALSTMRRSLIHNARFRATKSQQSDVLLMATGVGHQLVDGKWHNRLSDHFVLACAEQTLAIEDHFEWKWPFPRRNERVILHAPLQAMTTIVGRLRRGDSHRRQAERVLRIAIDRAKEYLDWSPGTVREAGLIERLSRKIAGLPYQYRAYAALLSRVRPQLLIVEGACYGTEAILLAVARRNGIVTAEYQHGAIAAGHAAYNFAPAVRNSTAYGETLPEYFLGYGRWWNDQINAPVTKIAMGNPHRTARVAALEDLQTEKNVVVFLSDGSEFAAYLAMAQHVATAMKSRGVQVMIRPHPLERSAVQAAYGTGIGDVSIDQNQDIYISLASAYAVVSEVSTGLFEAVGLADRIFVWDTPKARFGFPQHVFQLFTSTQMLVELLQDGVAGRTTASEVDAIWADHWRRNYLEFLTGQGVSCSTDASL